jgi:hypothetical protein
MGTTTRPVGISVIAILSAIAGAVLVLWGLALLSVGTFGALVGPMAGSPAVGILGALGIFGGLILLAIGAVELYTAYGAWNLKPWAWTWVLVLAIVGIVLRVGSFRGGLLHIIVNAVIIYYLYTPEVKAAFGRT